jgi:hypothetical protein
MRPLRRHRLQTRHRRQRIDSQGVDDDEEHIEGRTSPLVLDQERVAPQGR